MEMAHHNPGVRFLPLQGIHNTVCPVLRELGGVQPETIAPHDKYIQKFIKGAG
jgi:hypothetical protein